MATATTDGLRSDQGDTEAARKAGVDAANLVARMQLDAGMTAGQVEASAARVLGDRFTNPTPASDAFYAAYDETTADTVAEMQREAVTEPGDIEAG